MPKKYIDITYYCNKCGSTKVEVMMYVNINTLEVEDDPEYDSGEAGWCLDCQNNCNVTQDPDEWKEWAKINAGEEKMEANRENDK